MCLSDNLGTVYVHLCDDYNTLSTTMQSQRGVFVICTALKGSAYKCSSNIFYKAKIRMAAWRHKCLQQKVINSSSSESELQADFKSKTFCVFGCF